MILSINQPCYLGWAGLFERIGRADLHVHLDDVQYSRGTFFNRNRVVDAAGREVMLTVPVSAKLGDTFLQTSPANDAWRRKHEATLQQCYPKTRENEALLAGVHDFYAQNHANLADINIACTEWIARSMGITTPMVRASSLGIPGHADARLIAICEHFGARTYYSPAGARDYISHAAFDDKKIGLEYQSYTPVSYPQIAGREFVPFLSAVDVLLRHGPSEALRIVLAGAGAPTTSL